MLNSKQRAKLRSMASQTETILHFGKGGVSEMVVKQVAEALKARELVKIKVLENAPVLAKEAGFEIAEKTNAELVTVIGTKIVLYKKNEKEPKIKI